MTWSLAAFALLAVALAAGFAWYERSHPSSRTLALVATLAGLAALGRVAFAPLPSVKPTTDIVLIAGFALGGAPGFAVGAVAALASNVFFGQGPWTPWQMAAWGLVGLFGAALGAATGRRIGRIPLTVACGAAGLAFGVFMDAGEGLTFSGGQNGLLLARMAAGVPFDVAHAVGNVAFCLAFGPALVRALARFRDRFDVRWHPAGATLGVAVALVGATAAAPHDARAATAAKDPVAAAVGFLRSAQNADGGFGGARGQSSSPLFSAWAAMGLAATGHAPAATRAGGPSAADYVRASAGRVTSAGDVERTMLAMRASGLPAASLVPKLLSHRRASGSFDGQVNLTAFAVLALRAAGRRASDPAVARAGRWIAGQQNRDGGFSFATRGAPSGVDDTAAAVEGLVAAGRRRTRAVTRAVAYLRHRQQLDGGFALLGSASNAQSTAWAVQALVAAGVDPARVTRHGSRSPLGYLRSLVAPDGSVRYSRTSRQTPVWVTAQALTALARRPFPIAPPRAGAAAARRSTAAASTRERAFERQLAPGARLAGLACAGLLLIAALK